MARGKGPSPTITVRCGWKDRLEKEAAELGYTLTSYILHLLHTHPERKKFNGESKKNR